MKIGIDLGGTKTEIIVLNPTGDTVFRKRVDTPRDNYTKTIAMICDLVTEAKTSAKINKLKHIGIGIPGVISPLTGVIKNSNSTWLNGQTFREDLASSLGCEVRMANDANCMTLSEAVDGAGAGYNVVFAVILGTGCGAGITINGHILVGANAIGGEWGHNQLPWMDDHERDFAKSVNCYCGKYGCIEQFLSGSALANYYAYRLNTDKLFSSKEIITMADSGDTLALECMDLYERRLARSLAHVINILDPDIIVAAGGMSNIKRIYSGVNNQMKNWVFGNECNTQFIPATHGDSSGVRGAAWL